ncbi:MAG: hypothetical protein KatS3mg109_0386 [Pirellulaceae bacterium]|nr:MAG: hypothetical protein KatS3mg109_0386 [Pirellulaceae bacterium]
MMKTFEHGLILDGVVFRWVQDPAELAFCEFGDARHVGTSGCRYGPRLPFVGELWHVTQSGRFRAAGPLALKADAPEGLQDLGREVAFSPSWWDDVAPVVLGQLIALHGAAATVKTVLSESELWDWLVEEDEENEEGCRAFLFNPTEG